MVAIFWLDRWKNEWNFCLVIVALPKTEMLKGIEAVHYWNCPVSGMSLVAAYALHDGQPDNFNASIFKL